MTPDELPVALRIMRESDLAAVLTMQSACYPAALIEGAATIRQRLHASPDTAWIASIADEAAAYLFGYRSRLGSITPLGGVFSPADAPDCLYLHDLAVAPAWRRYGIADQLITAARAFASRQSLPFIALVALENARGFWERHAFATSEVASAQQAAHLASYPGTCHYMTHQLVAEASSTAKFRALPPSDGSSPDILVYG